LAQADDLAGVLAAALRSAGPMLVEIVVA
jgi:hypothetical protein